MIVEDEAALREVYCMLFRANKFDVYEAANGQIALDMMAETVPDIIVLDALMPVMGGIEFLRAAKLKQKYPGTCVLMLTNLSDAKTIELSQQLGAHRYMLKASASPADLIAAVNELRAAG
jgi:two-component system phosphate regulon response regulator PhoB